jgi:beta-glucosidase
MALEPFNTRPRSTDHPQKMAKRTRLGIPVSISSDPRHSLQQNVGAAIGTADFSQ